MNTLYSRMPGFVKGMWRGTKIEKYLSYSGKDTGVLYECADVIGKIAQSGGGETYSQYGQDWFIFNIIFHSRKNGIFLDIGANDPKIINNTLLFEKNGWDGIAFEPQKALAKSWKSRKTECMNIALGNTEKKIYFKEEDTLSKVVQNRKEATTVVKQRRLKDVLSERKINKVDFASIDVEGYEYSVLSGIDFSAVDFGILLIEISDSEIKNAKKTRDYLKDSGFVMIARLQIDDVWMNQNFLNGKW